MSGDWIRADWPAPQRILAGTTTRSGGVSLGVYASLNVAGHVGDTDESVELNRQKMIEMCGLPAEPRWLRQVHGTRVAYAGSVEFGDAAPAADAAIADSAGEVCAVLTADCLPILLCATDGSEVAAAHGGWRGLAAGICEATVAALSTAPELLIAWLGPAISQSAFEVGDEVRAAFIAVDPSAARCFCENEHGRWQADLYALARQRLATAGVGNVYGGGLCTYADAQRFFSYRRDGECGRMASFIVRRW